MKFGQLILYNMRNISVEKPYAKCGEETISRPLYINISICSSFIHFVFIMLIWDISNIVKPSSRSRAFTLSKAFLKKQKEVWNESPRLIFWMIFEERHFSCNILLTDQISLSCCLWFVKYWAICVLHLFVNQTVTS